MNINTKSINFKVCLYIFSLIFIILFLLWFLQVFFLNNYYDKMKVYVNTKMVEDIEDAYAKSDSNETFYGEISRIVADDDMYINIMYKGRTVYTSNENLDIYFPAMEKVGMALEELDSKAANTDMIVKDSVTQRDTWLYASYLDASHDTVMYVAAPLFPVTSTVYILKNQLAYISVILLVLALAMVIFISRKIAKPITAITNEARKLSNGEYGLTFRTDYSYSEINDLADTLNRTSYELERSSLLQRDLIANVSHDLRTPLTMVKSYAEMIRDLSGDIPEKRNAHLQIIIDEADRLNSLVNDILTLSDVQAGTLQLNIERFSIKDLVSSVLQPYEVLKQNEGYQIIFNCRQDTEVIGDTARIKQVVSNLVTNAIKYCGVDKKIFVNIKKWGKIVHIEVVDHGQGIKADELPYIWERYYKSSTNHVRATKGSGIGLSIVKGILTAHNARFGVESKVGRGTTFWFELEVAPEPSDSRHRPKENRIRLLR